MPTDPVIVLVWCLGLAIAGLLTWIAMRALCGDRFRGTPRCPRCWHDQTGVSTLTCPECGFTVREVRDRERTRRHWIPALLAVATLAGGAISLRMRFTGESVWAFVPTRVLIAVLPWTDGGPGRDLPQSELSYRIGMGGISPGSAEALVGRMLAGDADAPPGSREWGNRYGGLPWELYAASTSRGGNRLAGWEGWKRLAELPPRIELARLTWPERDEPMTVEIDAVGWWPGGWQARIRVEDPAGGAPARPIGFDPNATGSPVGIVRLDPPRPGEVERRLVIRVDRRERQEDGSWGAWSPRWEIPATVKLPVQPALPPFPAPETALTDAVRELPVQNQALWVQTPDPAPDAELPVQPGVQPGGSPSGLPVQSGDQAPAAQLPVQSDVVRSDDPPGDLPVQDPGQDPGPRAWTALDTPALAERLRRVFDDGFLVWERGQDRYGFRFDPQQAVGDEFANVLIGVVVEVLEGDAVRRRSRLWWPGGPRLNGRGWSTRWEIELEDHDALDRLPREAGEAAGWSVRITGDRGTALRTLALPGIDAARVRGHWAGTLRFPLVVRPVLGEAPERRFFPTDP